MQSRGIHTAMVNTESVNARACRTYVSLGFVEIDRAYFYVKEVGAKHP